MICLFYIMYDRTGIPFDDHEKCSPDCKSCTGDICANVQKSNEPLSGQRFGWLIENKVVFNKPKESKTGSTRYLSALDLIHPSSPDIWILNCERLNKNTEEWYSVLRLHHNGDCVEFDDMVSLNRWLKRHKYDGRKLTEEDFIIKEEK